MRSAWYRKPEIFRKALQDFSKSDKKAADILRLIYRVNFCLQPDNGLLWTHVAQIMKEELGEEVPLPIRDLLD